MVSDASLTHEFASLVRLETFSPLLAATSSARRAFPDSAPASFMRASACSRFRQISWQSATTSPMSGSSMVKPLIFRHWMSPTRSLPMFLSSVAVKKSFFTSLWDWRRRLLTLPSISFTW